jgi:hypothetical protein
MNILFLAYEIESHLMLELSRLYRQKIETTTFILNCDTWTFADNKNFYARYENSCDGFYNLESEYKTLNTLDEREHIDVDFNFLREFEDAYGLKINEVIKTDPILYTVSHDRDYYNLPKAEIKFKWIELVIRKILDVIAKTKPDYILTVGNNYFAKNIIHKIAIKKNIKLLTILPARINDLYIVTDNLGINTSPKFIKVMNGVGDEFREEALKIIQTISTKNLPAYFSHANVLSSVNELNFFRDIVGMIRWFKINSWGAIFHRTYYRGLLRLSYMGTAFFEAGWCHFRNTVIRKNVLVKRIKFAKKIPDGVKYFYFTLHVIPESTVLTQSDELDEFALIKEICAKLPVDTFLVVKENIEMIGLRPVSFYKKLIEVPNVILIDPKHNSMALIKRSLGVICMCGTALLEACIVNKKAIAIGNPEFSALNLVEKYYKNETQFDSEVAVGTNNILQYIQTVIKVGHSIDLQYLLYAHYRKNFNFGYYSAEAIKVKNMFDRYIGSL